MKITPNMPTYAPNTETTQEACAASLYALRERAKFIKLELYATHELYLQTGDHKALSRQAQLSVEYERALNQVQKAFRNPA